MRAGRLPFGFADRHYPHAVLPVSRFPPLMRTTIATLALACVVTTAAAQPAPSSGVRYNRLLIRNAMLVDGAGNPARGPVDIVVEGSTIAAVYSARPVPGSGSS